MKLEHAQLLMNRALDGVASAEERAQLASAMRADPLIRQEFEELQITHASAQSLFRQLGLPQDFSKQVMRRVQGQNVPNDEQLRLPERRSFTQRRMNMSRAHRKRVRVYAVVASVSAAASVMLILGVLSGFFTRNGIGTDGYVPPERSLADGRQGAPDGEGFNRTGPSTHRPGIIADGDESPGDSSRNLNDERRVDDDSNSSPERDNDNANEGKVVDNNKPSPDTQPVTPNKPEPRNPDESEVVEDEPDAKSTPRPDSDDGTVVESDPAETERPTEPSKNDTETVAEKRVVIGQVTVLSGRVYVEGPDKEWFKIEDDGDLHAGSRLKTSLGGVALMTFDTGNVTLGNKSEAVMETEDAFTLVDGDIALERGRAATGHSIELTIEFHRLILNSGSAVIERDRRGFEIIKPFGTATVTHDQLGSLTLNEGAPVSAKVDFDEETYQPASVQETIDIPYWNAESRAQYVLHMIDPSLSARDDFSRNERAYVYRHLPDELEHVMVHPVTSDSIIDFMTTSTQNTNLNGRDLKNTLGEVTDAILTYAGKHTPNQVMKYAAQSADEAEDYDAWKDEFYRLLRPATTTPPAKTPTTNGGTDCPNDNKLKRADNNTHKKRKKVVRKPLPNGEND